MLKKLKQLFSRTNLTDGEKIESNHSANSSILKGNENKKPSKEEEFKDAGDQALNANDLDLAELNYKQSIALNPSHVDSHVNLSVLYRMRSQYEQAITCLEAAKQIDPNDAYVDYNLGTIAQMQGNTQLAISHFQNAIALNNTFEIAYVDLFNLQFQLGDFLSAEKTIIRALKFVPRSAECHFLLGNLEKERNNWELAATSYWNALAINPELVQAHAYLGTVLEKQGKLEEAVASYTQVLKLNPELSEAQYFIADVLVRLGKNLQAEQAYRKFLVLKPNSDKGYFGLAKFLDEQGRIEESIANYRTAITINPNFVEAHNNLSVILSRQYKFEEAVASLYTSLSIKPDNFEVLVNMGSCYSNLGDFQKAIACFRKAIEINPGSNLMLNCLYTSLCCDSNTSQAQYYAEVSAHGKKLQAKVKPYLQWNINSLSETQSLKVGLVSGDMRAHPVGFFLENIVKHIDKTRLQLIAYSTESYQDAISSSIKAQCVAWHNIEKLTDQEAAEKIHNDGVNILIDLSGYTNGNRLTLFCWRPSPIQISWLGYFASTGIPTMDYLLADPVSVPQEYRKYYTEELYYLPDTRLCLTPPVVGQELEVADLPALRNKYITFASFQRLEKITDNIIIAWGHIFKSLPQAKLRLQSRSFSEASYRQNMLDRLSEVGITADRVMLFGVVSRDEYLQSYSTVDIALDTFPYTGGTTTCEALWMGVPTLTIVGDKMIERQGAGLMTAAGYPEWVASDVDDYIAKAIRYAKDVNALALLRQGMREKVRTSLVFNAEKFSKNLEEALFDIWKKKSQELSN